MVEEPQQGRGVGSRALFGAALLVGAVAAVLEWSLALLRGAGDGLAHLALVLGLWLATSYILASVLALGLRLAGGADAFARTAAWLAEFRSVAWRERGEAADRRRLGVLVGVATAPLVFLAVGVPVTIFLVQEANDAKLIGLASGAVHLAASALAVFAAVVVTRLVTAAGARLPRVINAPIVGLLGLGVGVIALVVLFVLRWDWLLLADIPPLALVITCWAALFGLALARPQRFGFRWPLLLAGGVVAIGLFLAGTSSSGARAGLARYGLAAPFLQAALLESADFDRDGAASAPLGRDCAPFDPAIHPLAREIPDNGVDENCDGDDTAPQLGEGRRVAEVPTLLGEAPDLVLVTVDSLRGDHMGFHGYHRATTPHLDELAPDAVIFRRAYSQDSGTGPSFWSLMTGKTPFQVALHDASRFPPLYDDAEQPLAELLNAAGYRTAAVLCGSVFASERWTIRRGFDTVLEVCGRQQERLAEHVSARALEQVTDLSASDAPFFLWVHMYDPHHPYADHLDIQFGGRNMDRYDEEIRYTDEHAAAILGAVLDDERERDRPVYAFFSSDHGENFEEHGTAPHARTLYREVLNVPLMVFGPDLEARQVTEPVALNDLYPTMLHVAGIAPPTECSMDSLVPILRGAPAPPDRPIFGENSYSRPRRHVKSVIRGDFHLLRDLTQDTVELYNMETDPGEVRDLAGQGNPVEAELREIIDAFIQTTHIPADIR